MQCDTVGELFDDIERARLSPSLHAEVTGHLAGCPACREGLARHRAVVAALAALPAPALPDGFEADLVRRIGRVGAVPLPQRVAGFFRHSWPVVIGYAASAAVAASATVAALYAGGVSFGTTAPSAVHQPPGGLITLNLPAPQVVAPRVCDASDDAVPGLHVKEGEDVDVTLSVQTPEPMEGAKVYVVLPKGLAFSPTEHPDLQGKRVLSYEDDFEEGQKDMNFTVRGTAAGKWDVTALVEQGDSLLLTGTTIVVASKEDEP